MLLIHYIEIYTSVFLWMVYIVGVWPSQSFVPMSASSSWRGVQCSQISNSPWTWHKTRFGDVKPAATGVFRPAEIVDFITMWHEAMDESIQMHQKSSKHPSSLLLLEEPLHSTSTKIHSELAGIVQTCATDTVCFWLKMAKKYNFYTRTPLFCQVDSPYNHPTQASNSTLLPSWRQVRTQTWLLKFNPKPSSSPQINLFGTHGTRPENVFFSTQPPEAVFKRKPSYHIF